MPALHGQSEFRLARIMHIDGLIGKCKQKLGKIRCEMCGKEVAVKVRNGSSTRIRALEHALIHLNKPVYQCNLCFKNLSNTANMRYHLKTIHKASFEDRSDDFHVEIVECLSKCYG